jgi:hypothetical protein
MASKAIPFFPTADSYQDWFMDYCDSTLTSESTAQAHQVNEYNRLKCSGPMHRAFHEKSKLGFWVWPPQPLKRTP